MENKDKNPKRIAVIMPTRSAGGIRDSGAAAAAASWLATTSGQSDFYYGVDDDDFHNYEIPNYAKQLVNPRVRLVPKLNLMASQLQDNYDYLLFIGDDHRFVTPGWEEAFIRDGDALGGVAILYGNDLLQRKALPTAVFIGTAITKILGYMAPPCIQHMYADNFWKDLGEALSIIKYYPDIIIEHLHFSNGKAKVDNQYREVAALMGSDGAAYKQYIAKDFSADVEKVRAVCVLQSSVVGSTDA